MTDDTHPSPAGHPAPRHGRLRDRLLLRLRSVRRPGVRTSVTVIAGAVVLLAVAAVSGGLLLLLHWSSTTSLDSAAGDRAAGIVTALGSGTAPADLDPAVLERSYGADVIQVVDAAGRVVAGTGDTGGTGGTGSAGSAGGDPLVSPSPDLPGTGTRSDVHHHGARYRVTWETATATATATAGTDGTDGRYLVVVAADDEAADRLLHIVAVLLALATPVIAAVAAVVVRALVGRALDPVTRIVGEATEISAADLTRRVTVPAPDDEIRRVAVAVNGMLDRIETGRRRQTEFIGDASHELRSPLATLSALLELAERDGAGLDARQVREVAAPEVRRLATLVEDLLFLARGDEGTVSRAVGDVDLDDVVQQEITRLRAVAPELTVTGSVAPVRVTGDAAALTRAVRNLTDNALHHASSRIRVTVGAVDPAPGDGGDGAGRVAQVTVDDDGPGIPAADRDRVFDRFVRLDPSRARHRGGTGLGLAITAQIAAAHGGRVAAAQAPPPLSGARMTLEVPAQASPELPEFPEIR